MISLDSTVIHKSFGTGKVMKQDNGIITVAFSDCERRFQFPEAFRQYLKFEDDKLNMSIQNEIKILDDEKQKALSKPTVPTLSDQTKRAVRKRRGERPNIAFKCNFCDGGANRSSIGYNGVCSDEIIYNNIELEHRTWCSTEGCGCMQYMNGEITRQQLDEMCTDGGFVCYESQMLREWKAMAGIVQRGDRIGQPMRLNNVQRNSLCVLTTRDPMSTEEDRYIFAVFLVDDTYGGDEQEEGFVSTRSEYRVMLSYKEAHKMPFWKYHANGKNRENAVWSQGLQRYMDDTQAMLILHDICELKRGTSDEGLANRFLATFSEIARIDVDSIGKPNGALTK